MPGAAKSAQHRKLDVIDKMTIAVGSMEQMVAFYSAVLSVEVSSAL
jgi:catechol-2,3-dioxygenase